MNELGNFKLGNYAKWDLNDPRDWEDDFDYGYSESQIEEWQLEEPERLSPIKINDDYLLQFGFEKISNIRWRNEKLNIGIAKGYICIYITDCIDPIMYVHEFQNFISNIEA